MAVYDDENQDDTNPLTPAELGQQEERAADTDDSPETTGDADDQKGGRFFGNKTAYNKRKKAEAADAADWADTEAKLGGIQSGLGKGSAGGGFYKNDSAKGFSGKRGSRMAAARGVLSNKKMVAGVGGGGVALIFGFMAFFSLLHTFQMDHFFKNVEGKTASRLAASLDSRNRTLTQAYIKIRATEIEGGTANDNLYFKGNKVDTGNPMRDWYATMRTSKFEKELLEKQGIHFTSMVDKDGNISVAKITANDPAAAAKLNKVGADGKRLNKDNFNDRLNSLDGKEMEKLFTVDSFDNSKAARKSVKEVVNANVPWYKTFKRRAIRKDIANTTGIKNWRLFEKTRDKLAKNKQDVKDRLLNKIVDKYYSNNPASAQFMKCIFSNGRCSGGSDPSNPDNHAVDPAHGTTPDELAGADTNPETTDATGKKVPGDSLATGAAGVEVDTAVREEIKDGLTREVAQEGTEAATKFSLRQKLILATVRTVTGGTVSDAIPFNPTKVWTYAKRIAKVHGLIGSAVGASKLMDMVSNARNSQLQGIYATYAMASDQMKSGQLTGGELNDFFDTTKNIGNTEGWAAVSGQLKTNTVSAAAATNISKETFCSPEHVRSETEFGYLCDQDKPNGGGNAQTITDTYNKTVGPIAAPIAQGVNTVQESPIGGIADWVNGTLDSIIGKALDPIITAIMDGTALGKTVSDFMGVAMSKMFEFLGAAPKYAGGDPALGSYLVAGGAGSAEGTTRGSGGIKSTTESLSYSNHLAAQFTENQKAKQSIAERYASLNNPESLASSTLFAVSTNLNSSQLITRLSSALSNLPATFSSIFSNKVFAADPQPASSIADWAGVQKYDIPQVCIDLDPLDPDHLNKSTNVSTIGLSPQTLGYDTLRDTNKFWKAVYDKLGTSDTAQEQAEKIYNCALFDARAMGSLGYVYGYNKDNGYEDTATTEAQTSTGQASDPNIYVLGDSLTVGMRDSGGLEQKLKDKHWQSVVISAECGRHLQLDGVACGTSKPTFPGGFKQADNDQAEIAKAGTVVIGLGTNDPGDPNFGANVTTMIDKIHNYRADAKIYWVNLYSTDPSGPKYPAMNETLNNLSKTKGFTVIDWATAAPPNYAPGNLHPNGHYDKMAELVANTIGEPAPSATTPGSDGGTGVVAGDAVQTGLGLAWDTRKDSGGVELKKKSDAKPTYQVAMPKYNGSPERSDGISIWTDCGVFVSTVMRASGVDPNFPIQGTTNMQPYMRNHPEKYQIITEDAQSSAGMQPGDIIINTHHIMLFVGMQPKGYDTVDASLDDRVPGAKIFAKHPDYDKGAEYHYMVARPKK